MRDTITIFTVPGLYGSGTRHWQTRWEKLYGFSRIEQNDWDNPEYSKWDKLFCQKLAESGSNQVILVAHSLGCHLILKSFIHVNQWIKGIFFVAPPDLKSTTIKKDLYSFHIDTPYRVDVPAYLIYSENDPFASAEYSEKLGHIFGLHTINIGKHGHINSDSDIGNWDEGYALFKRLIRQIP
ncbi:MAG TPA: alpha/beta hydrolase [Chitinispirillaceae bacterium]|nr:alpha/beta hydrolase [Chitinispirillaceae bacterium]